MNYIIDEKLAAAIGTYLYSRPYAEVVNLVKGLEAMPPLNDITIQAIQELKLKVAGSGQKDVDATKKEINPQ